MGGGWVANHLVALRPLDVAGETQRRSRRASRHQPPPQPSWQRHQRELPHCVLHGCSHRFEGHGGARERIWDTPKHTRQEKNKHERSFH